MSSDLTNSTSSPSVGYTTCYDSYYRVYYDCSSYSSTTTKSYISYETYLGIYLGTYAGYMLLFVIGAIVCYCYRKKWVERTAAFDMQNGGQMVMPNHQVYPMASNNQLVGMPSSGVRNHGYNLMNSTLHRINPNQSLSYNNQSNDASLQQIGQDNSITLRTGNNAKTFPPLQIPQAAEQNLEIPQAAE